MKKPLKKIKTVFDQIFKIGKVEYKSSPSTPPSTLHKKEIIPLIFGFVLPLK